MKKKKRSKVPQIKDIYLPGSIKDGKPYNFFKHGVTQSIIAKCVCRQKAVLGLNRWRKKSINMIFGSCFHEVLDYVYSYFMDGGKVPKFILIKKHLRKYMRDEMKEQRSQRYVDELVRSVNVTELMIPLYIDYHKKDFTKTKWIEVEKTFNVRVEGIRQRGKRDGIFLDKKEKKKWLIEHKSKARINVDDILLKLTFDFQCLYYICMYEIETSEKIEGVKYNIIRKPGNKLEGKASYKALAKKIEKEPEYYFMRYENFYTNKDKVQFMEELLIRISELKEFFRGNLPVYRNQFLCTAPYPCEYLGACSSGSLKGYKVEGELFQELK